MSLWHVDCCQFSAVPAVWQSKLWLSVSCVLKCSRRAEMQEYAAMCAQMQGIAAESSPASARIHM